MNLWLNNHIAIKATTPNPKFVENLFQKFDVSDNRSTVKSENRFPQPKVPCISNENLKFTDIPTSILESMDLDSEMMATDLIFGDQSCKTVVFDVSKHFDKGIHKRLPLNRHHDNTQSEYTSVFSNFEPDISSLNHKNFSLNLIIHNDCAG